jgi:hypothetical protein
MATNTGLHRTRRYYALSPLKQLASAAVEFKLDLIGYVTAKIPFNSPRQNVSVITWGLEGGLSSLYIALNGGLQLGGKIHFSSLFFVFLGSF